MKKNILSSIFATTIFSLLFSSCAKDDFGKPTNPVETGDEILFGSSLTDDDDTRTVYGNRTNSGIPVYWAPNGDSIAIFCLQSSAPESHLVKYRVLPSETDSSKSKTVAKINPKEAGLQWGSSEEHRFYAFYPADAVKGSYEENQTGKITANIPVTQQVQAWRKGTISGEGVEGKTTYFGLPNMDYAYMYAFKKVNKSDIAEGGKIDLAFHNLVTVLDITVQGPDEGEITVTNINVSAVEGQNPILTGDFTCFIRGAEEGNDVSATCEPTGDLHEVRNLISIPCYDRAQGQYISLKKDECLNVKAYLIPDDINTIEKQVLKISVATLNGGSIKTKTLQTAAITPHKINRVLLPKLVAGGTNYWMSSLDPKIYISELSIPGSKFSVLTEGNGASPAYQKTTIEQQFQDGIRAFILQTETRTKNLGSTYKGLYVMSGNTEVMTIQDAIKDIATYLDKCEAEGKKNEFAFILLTYQSGEKGWLDDDGDNRTDEQYWLKKLQDAINDIANDPTYRIYTDEVTANTTIEDVAGKIVLKANYNSQKMIEGFESTTCPILFTLWEGYYGPYIEGSKDVFYQDINGGMPMTWGTPVWYLDIQNPGLKWYYQEATSVGSNTEATEDQKIKYIETLFTESVELYKNDNTHSTWFMNDLGGTYKDDPNGVYNLALKMNDLGVDQLQNRPENAGLGLIFMNFADKQAGSGAECKSDWLIQTIIDNNFKFALRKEGTTTYDAKYEDGGFAID